MRPLILILFFVLSVRAGAAVPQLLQDAVKKLAQDTDRWAYTQTSVEKDGKGNAKSDVVVRFDPSKPYAEQYTPIKIDGKEPTESQIKKYRRQGEKRGERIEKEATTGEVSTSQRKSLGELMDLENATVLEENEKNVTYAQKGGEYPPAPGKISGDRPGEQRLGGARECFGQAAFAPA
jgi:hypothetical protein